MLAIYIDAGNDRNGNIASTQRIEVAKSVYRDVHHHAYGGLPSERSQRSPRRGR